jgi:hypothetical protein
MKNHEFESHLRIRMSREGIVFYSFIHISNPVTHHHLTAACSGHSTSKSSLTVMLPVLEEELYRVWRVLGSYCFRSAIFLTDKLFGCPQSFQWSAEPLTCFETVYSYFFTNFFSINTTILSHSMPINLCTWCRVTRKRTNNYKDNF